MDLKVKVTDKKLTPFRAHGTAAGLDLRAPGDYTLHAGQTVQIDTGVAVEIPTGYFGLCVPCALPDIVLVDELGETTRGAGGFGSTGTA